VIFLSLIDRKVASASAYFVVGYQKFLSPYLGNNCRFHPTCSQYSLEALKSKGFVVGFLLAVWRIIRCNPFNSGGNDPVR